MNKSVLILEDNEIQLKNLSNITKDCKNDLSVFCAASYLEAVNILKKYSGFVFFMIDIDLGDDPEKKDGLDFARYLRSFQEYEFTPIVYITSVTSRTEEALSSTHCYEYITKPYKTDDIIGAIKNMLRMPKAEPPKLDIKGIHDTRIRISMANIYYIEALGHEILFHTKQGLQITKSYSLKKISSMLPDYFENCHKSYIINMHYLSGYDIHEHKISLSGIKETIPVGRNYQKYFINLFS